MPRPRIEDELNTVRVGENRYRIADGRVMSRQRIEQIRHPDRRRARARWFYRSENGQRYNKQYYQEHRESILAYQREYRAKQKAALNEYRERPATVS